ncbi:cytochrome b5 [Apiospora marii]|uniref:Cytochrome b5 n=1 Tax=Apiospora marii TaxID=335849 RepID=A0ABR1SJC7_9PEZI
MTPLGPMLRNDGHPAADDIRGKLGQVCKKVGKLLIPRTAEQIAEYDGEEGMPMWIVIGTTVYDITTFTFGTQMEKGQLTENPGGRPKRLPDDPDVYEDLLKRLQPFRCALFEGIKALRKTVLPPFTPAMLGWHDNPTSGMYISVDGIIYNVSAYVERHPGGRDILAQAFGREANDFYEFHGPDTMADFAELAVGKLVPEIERDQIEEGHVAIHDWVFDLSKLDASAEDQWVLPVVAHLVGKDASEAIQEPGEVSNALVHIYTECKEAIVAHVESAEVGEIPMGEVARHNNPRSSQGAWVTIEGNVFDVTTLMLHGKSIHGKELPHMWAGTELEDEGLCEWLRQYFPYRIIGRAVAGEAIPEPTVEELLKSRVGPSEEEAKEDELQRLIWGIDKDDPSCGGRIRFCGRGERGHGRACKGEGGGRRKFGQGDLENFLRNRAAKLKSASGRGGKKRSADVDGKAAAGPSVKRRV